MIWLFLAHMAHAFYATNAVERSATFTAVLRSDYTTLADFFAHREKVREDVGYLAFYLHGPLQNRTLGTTRAAATLDIAFPEARVVDGRVVVPFRFSGTMLIKAGLGETLELPLPYDFSLRKKPDAEHCRGPYGDEWFAYRWDPTREKCANVEGVDYQTLRIALGPERERTRDTHPPYARLVRDGKLSMTFAFGYNVPAKEIDPFRDTDSGAARFYEFGHAVDGFMRAYGFEQEAVFQSDYGGDPERQIGTRFRGVKDGVAVTITIVATGDIEKEPMRILAKSFAQDHDAFFGWFGHQRIDNDQDIKTLREILEDERYSITPDFQLLYFAGCSGYRQYVPPFFKMKTPGSLHVLSNGLESDGRLLAVHALTLFDALFYRERNRSYQDLIDRLEAPFDVFANVTGDAE